MTLQSLPSEVVELIAQHLSVEDILACCATCSSMRHVFNDDFIWKRKCNLEVIDYLKSTECLVEPSVDWLEVTDDELCPLSPLPTWRKCYMMQTRLYRNWREGRYEKEEVKFGTNTGFYISTFARFYKNDHLFLYSNNVTEGGVISEVWNVKESSCFHLNFILDLRNFFKNDEEINLQMYEIVDDKFIVSKENLVLIYNICLPNSSPFHLVKAFLFDLSEDESHLLVTRARTEPEFYLPEGIMASAFVCGHFLIGRLEDSFTLHIWNILSGEKATKENYPINSNVTDLRFICRDEENKTVIIKLYLERVKHRFHYKAYDLSKMEFSSFDVKHNYCDVVVLKNKIVIGADSNRLFSYDYETSRSLAVRKCNYEILKKTITFVGNNLLCGTSDSTVFVMNSSLDVLSSHKLTFTLYSLSPVCNRFVLINRSSPEVWEIGKSAKQLVKFPIYSKFAGINQHCSKIAIEKSKKIIILNFW